MIPASRRVSRKSGSRVLGEQAATTTRLSPFSLVMSVISLAELVAQENTWFWAWTTLGRVLQYSTVSGTFDDAGDIGPAMADEDPYPRLLLGDIPFLRVYPFFGEVSPPVVEELADLGAGAAGAEDRLGDIHRTLEGPAYEDPGPVGLHGVDSD